MPRADQVSLVLCTFKRLEMATETCRQVLALQALPGELIVVAQAISPVEARGLHDSLAGDFAEAGVAFRVLVMESPNLPLARNIGILDARGSQVLFIDDDVVLTSEIVLHHSTALAGEGVGAVGGHITGEHPWPWHNLADGASIDRVIGCNMSFNRRALEEAGGFDPGFAPASTGEETDLSDRLTRRGWRLIYSSEASLLHLKSPSGGERGRQKDDNYWASYVRNASVLWLRAHGLVGFLGLLRHPHWFSQSTPSVTLRGLRAAWRDRAAQDYLAGAESVYVSEAVSIY